MRYKVAEAMEGQLTSLGLLAGLLLELFELLLVLRLNFDLHLGELNLVLVFGLSDLLLEHGAVVLPLGQFELVQEGFLCDVRVRLVLFFDFLDGNLALFHFGAGLVSKLIDITLHILHRFIGQLLVLLLKVEHFVAQHQQLLHFVCVSHGELLNNLLLLFALLLELLD